MNSDKEVNAADNKTATDPTAPFTVTIGDNIVLRGNYLKYFELTIPKHLYLDWQRCFIFHRLSLEKCLSLRLLQFSRASRSGGPL